LTTERDLIRLDLRAPLVDAVCASVCDVWCEAADLWLEVSQHAPYRALAMQCGAQASLNAGLLDLAEYFLIGLRDLPDMPAFLAVLWARQVPVREARIKHYSRIIDAAPARIARCDGREFMRLHLYREAIHQFLADGAFGRNPRLATPHLARAFYRLGAHASLIDLSQRAATHMTAPELTTMVERARRLLKRRGEPPALNLARFQEQHPAGAALTRIIDALGSHADSEDIDDL
jgi:lipopolysaccharide biosynthesis regulator YciM